MKHQINEFIAHLVIYDYILFGLCFFLFILLVILAIALRGKMALAMISILFAFLVLLLGPSLGYYYMHAYLYKATVDIQNSKKLEFTPAIVLNGTYTNESKFNFSTCKIKASVYKVATDEMLASVKNMIFPFNPFLKETIIVNKDIKPNEVNNYKLIIEPFNYQKDYNISVGITCR